MGERLARARALRGTGGPRGVTRVFRFRAVSAVLALIVPYIALAKSGVPAEAFEPEVRLRGAWAVRLYTNPLLALSPTDEAKCGWIEPQGLVVCGSREGRVVALDPAFGDVVWEIRTRGAVYGRPCGVPNGVAVASADGCLYLVESSKGRLKGRFCPEAGAIHGSPLCTDEVIYFVTVQDKLFAIEVPTLKQLFSYAREQPEGVVGKGSSPGALRDDRLFAGFSDGTVVGLDIRTGRQVWVTRVAKGSRLGDLRDVEWVTVLPDGRVYAAPVLEGPVVMAPDSGVVTWRGKYLGPGLPVAVKNRLIFTTSAGEVVALDATTLDTLFVRRLPSCAYDPVLVFRWLVVGSDDGLYLIDPEDGWPIHGLAFLSGVRSRPLALKNRLFFVTGQGFVHAVDVMGL